ncbi:MAG TPA: hypothetical protein VFT29_11935 [Gemmatimonadaceae bacterium]|nr:hypothetical protein [Gemmatimonadaceae bacterium]
MKIIKVSALAAAAAIIGLASCSDSTSVASRLLPDSTVTADVAVSAGDALAQAVTNMMANEAFSSLSVASSAPAAVGSLYDFSRTRTCYDANDAVVANCQPLSAVRKIVTHVLFSGSRSGTIETTGGTTKTWTGAVHRESNDTLTRQFNTAQPPVEISRTHNDVTTGHDTTTFSEGDVSRLMAESTVDSIKSVLFELPHATHPWPSSGSIVRVVAVHVSFTKGAESGSRDKSLKVTVTFPADAQGNVPLTINDKTCTLNLVTHRVVNCHPTA